MTSAKPAPRRGEIWYTFIPAQPDDPHQPRPALIISENVCNRLTDDLIVVPIFSSGRLGPTHVAIASGQGGLRHDGVLFCEELCTIDRDFLTNGPLGALVPDDILAQVVRAIRTAVGETVL